MTEFDSRVTYVEIVIEPVLGGRFMGRLYLDGECVDTAIDARPGCVARIIMNRILDQYGRPDGEITLNIEGW